MPRIDILEQDLTRATGTAGTDIPFIPGFVKETQYSYRKKLSYENGTHRYDSDSKTYLEDSAGNYIREQITKYYQPIYCTSKESFEAIFGKDPYVFTATNEAGNVKIQNDSVDKSYIMAKELLSMGMPVYYYGIQVDDAVVNFNNIISSIDAGDFNVSGNSITLDAPLTEAKSVSVNLSTSIKTDDILEVSILNTDAYEVTIDDDLTIGDEGKYIGEASVDSVTLSINVKSGETSKENDVLRLSLSIRRAGDSGASSTRLASFYSELKTLFTSGELNDKGEYTIKYLTTGGYPNFEVSAELDVANQMLSIAADRGDAIAIIESIDNKDRSLDPDMDSFYRSLQEPITNGEYGAAFSPWANYSFRNSYKIDSDKKLTQGLMPACFGYLTNLAANIKVSPNWLAMAGTTRGLIPNILSLNTTQRLSNVIANAYQPTVANGSNTRALIAITDIKPYGLCIWGNRTLKAIGENGLTGTNFLNTRNMISDIKKVAYRVAKSLIYEQNNETLWLNFKSQVAPFLEQLKSGAGIADYKLLKLDTHYNGSSLGKEEFACTIRIIPVYAVEAFEITVVVSDADVAVE